MLDPAAQSKDATRKSLKQRVMHAGRWSLVGYGANQIVRFGTNLFLTRLLVPDMFGLMAIATIILVALTMFSDLGLRPSVVQSKRGDEPAFLNTAWVVQILRGVILWLIALGIALLVEGLNWIGFFAQSSVYADPRLPSLISILSITVLISGLNSTKLLEASRHLALGRLTVIEFIAQAVGVVCTLLWVAFDRSVWALVAGNLCTVTIAMLLSHSWMPGTANRLQWDSSAFDEIFRFGRWIFLSSILGFLASNADRLFLGGVTTATVLGVYVIAYSLVASVETVLLRIIGSVAFPALSEIARERPYELKKTYYRLHSTIAPFVYFCSGVLMIAGNILIRILYDPRYEAAGWMLQILAVALVVVPSQMSLQCFMALGMPQVHSRVLGVRLIVLCVCMPVGAYFFDVPGALWGIVLSQLLCLPMTLAYAIRHGLFDLRRELLSLLGLPIGMVFGELCKLVIGAII